jgi:site-specific DNA-cytosine methylase
LFCGIGGFWIAADSLGLECVFSSDIDPACYFGDRPAGDITTIEPSSLDTRSRRAARRLSMPTVQHHWRALRRRRLRMAAQCQRQF